MPPRVLLVLLIALLTNVTGQTRAAPLQRGEGRVWDAQEITLQAARDYANPYVDVVCWIELEGPGFARRVYGFWDGGRTFRIRFVATAPGEWSWRTGSNQPDDAGLNGGAGAWTASRHAPRARRERARALWRSARGGDREAA